MFSFRPTRQSALIRQINSSTTTSRVAAGRRFAHEGYGSGATKSGEPNPVVDQEHPGPPKPKAAQQSNKGGQQQEQQQPSGGKQQSSNTNESTSKPQPKILNENPPAQGQESEDVAKHNREVEQRADKANMKVENEDADKDKVPKSFWKGHGGVDKDP